MHHPTDRISHTTAFVTPVVEHWLEREIAQWVHPMKDRSDDPSHHERTLLPLPYIINSKVYKTQCNKSLVLEANVVNTHKLDIRHIILLTVKGQQNNLQSLI